MKLTTKQRNTLQVYAACKGHMRDLPYGELRVCRALSALGYVDLVEWRKVIGGKLHWYADITDAGLAALEDTDR